MMRYLIAYAQRADARFLSHLEVARVFERALRRADLPLKLSQGFNPRPYLSFALPLAVGVAGRSEYLEIELADSVPAEEIAKRLAAELPSGFKVKAVRPAVPGIPALPSLVAAAAYLARPFWQPEPTAAAVELAVTELLSREEISAGEKGKERNIRPGIWRVRPRVLKGRLHLSLLLAAGSRQHVRPEWVLEALASLGGWQKEKPAVFLRLGVFACCGKEMVPLGLIRAPVR